MLREMVKSRVFAQYAAQQMVGWALTMIPG